MIKFMYQPLKSNATVFSTIESSFSLSIKKVVLMTFILHEVSCVPQQFVGSWLLKNLSLFLHVKDNILFASHWVKYCHGTLHWMFVVKLWTSNVYSKFLCSFCHSCSDYSTFVYSLLWTLIFFTLLCLLL